MITVYTILLILSGTSAAMQGPPQNRMLEATYEPGGTCDDCFMWRATVEDDGTVRQKVKSQPGWNAPDSWVERPARKLTRKQLATLSARLTGEQFLSLSEKYSADYKTSEVTTKVVTDQDTVTVWARVGNQSKQVWVYGPEVVAGLRLPDRPHPDRQAGRRFCRIWAQVLEVIKSPNAWQKAKYYRCSGGLLPNCCLKPTACVRVIQDSQLRCSHAAA